MDTGRDAKKQQQAQCGSDGFAHEFDAWQWWAHLPSKTRFRPILSRRSVQDWTHPFFECGPYGFYTVSRIYLGATSIRNIIMRLSAQPLAQFLLLGAAIFALYTMVARPETAPTEIRVGSTELR